jgi:hypothetical protein
MIGFEDKLCFEVLVVDFSDHYAGGADWMDWLGG